MARRHDWEVIPSAHRLIYSLRDLGYDLHAAIAELIDNSVTAGATEVHVDLRFEGEASWIRIADNGVGMTPAELREAMRFGTRRTYDSHDLGRFGLGLKAASLSQCRCLTVATRTTLSGSIRTAKWDLDHVEDTDRWEVLRPGLREAPLATMPLRHRLGTVVVWEDLDRVFRYRLPAGERARADFARAADEVQQHLSMVFHRFLSGEARRHAPLNIYLNGKAIAAWDPFARSEPGTVRLPIQHLHLSDGDTSYTVDVRPYVLPSETKFSTPLAHRRAAGPGRWNRQQGFYIYRRDRMIQSGGWCRLRAADEHAKLARISVDVPSGADGLFDLNVLKTQVRVPAGLRAQLSTIASSVAGRAQEIYRMPALTSGNQQPPVSRVDPRPQAINAIVEMVVTAAGAIIHEELGGSDVACRIESRMRQMQASVACDLNAALLGEAASPGRSDPASQSL